MWLLVRVFLHVALVAPERVGVEDAQVARVDLVTIVLQFHVLDELAHLVAAKVALVAQFG